MAYCLTSCLFDGMEAYMRTVAVEQLHSPTAQFTLQATQLHSQYVQQFESQPASAQQLHHPLPSLYLLCVACAG